LAQDDQRGRGAPIYRIISGQIDNIAVSDSTCAEEALAARSELRAQQKIGGLKKWSCRPERPMVYSFVSFFNAMTAKMCCCAAICCAQTHSGVRKWLG
jgi:hypothetical protein